MYKGTFKFNRKKYVIAHNGTGSEAADSLPRRTLLKTLLVLSTYKFTFCPLGGDVTKCSLFLHGPLKLATVSNRQGYKFG